MYNRDDVVNDLKGGIVRVTFTKKNGDERVMECTLKTQYLPEITDSVGSNKEVNPDVVNVWDLEKDGWRSFRLDSVRAFEIIT